MSRGTSRGEGGRSSGRFVGLGSRWSAVGMPAPRSVHSRMEKEEGRHGPCECGPRWPAVAAPVRVIIPSGRNRQQPTPAGGDPGGHPGDGEGGALVKRCLAAPCDGRVKAPPFEVRCFRPGRRKYCAGQARVLQFSRSRRRGNGADGRCSRHGRHHLARRKENHRRIADRKYFRRARLRALVSL